MSSVHPATQPASTLDSIALELDAGNGKTAARRLVAATPESARAVVAPFGVAPFGVAGEYRRRRDWFKHRADSGAPPPPPSEDERLIRTAATGGDSPETYRARRQWFAERVTLPPPPTPPPSREAYVLALVLLVTCTVFGMCSWFSAGAVTPQLCALFGVDAEAATLLTLGVNFGFLCGALASVATNLADRVRPSRLVGLGSLLAAGLNAGLLLPGCTFEGAVVLRVLTGAAMALVYPQACKVAATWFVDNRGLAMGLVVGSVGLGAATPHLGNALAAPPVPDDHRGGGDNGDGGWQWLIVGCSGLSVLAGLLALTAMREGPHYDRSQRRPTTAVSASFSLVLRNRAFWLSTLAYAGHNWELYAFWLWFKAFAQERGVGAFLIPPGESANATAGGAAAATTVDTRGASLAAFFVVGSALIGSAGGGYAADKVGRTTVCVVSLAVSIVGSLTIGWIESPALVLCGGLVWGIFSIAESAQYSAMTAELVDPRVVGKAVTVQFGIGYLATMPGMFVVPAIAGGSGGWTLAWSTLAPGTLLALVCAVLLRRTRAARGVALRRGRPYL